MDKITISLSLELRDYLLSKRVYRRESYDDILRRILNISENKEVLT